MNCGINRRNVWLANEKSRVCRHDYGVRSLILHARASCALPRAVWQEATATSLRAFSVVLTSRLDSAVGVEFCKARCKMPAGPGWHFVQGFDMHANRKALVPMTTLEVQPMLDKSVGREVAPNLVSCAGKLGFWIRSLLWQFLCLLQRLFV